jgi:hypothetical protein
MNELTVANSSLTSLTSFASFSTNTLFTQASTITFNSSLSVEQPTSDSLGSITFNFPTRIQSLTTSSLTLNQTNPQSPFDITTPLDAITLPVLRNSVASDSAVSTFLTNFSTNTTLLPTNTNNSLIFYYKNNTTNYKQIQTGISFFTGQHTNVSADPRLTPSTLSSYIGHIVIATDEPPISYRPDGTRVEGKDAVWITETLPQISLAQNDMDPRIWGVITNVDNTDNESFANNSFDRIRINGTGEGAIWVTNHTGGSFACGDYICSSKIPGLGRRQDDDKVHNYTVAKITMSCDFSLTQNEYICEEFQYKRNTYRRAFVGCVYCCS